MNTSSPSSTEVPDILDIYIPEPPPDYLAMFLWTALAVILLITVAWLLVYFVRQDRLRRAQPGGPRTIALSRMNRLEAESATMTPNEFGLRLSDIVKDFLHANYGDRFRFETAEEFLARFHKTATGSLPPVTQASLTNFVDLCEELKFGRPGDAGQRCQPLLDEARLIINDRPPAVDSDPKKSKSKSKSGTKSKTKTKRPPANHASSPPAAR